MKNTLRRTALYLTYGFLYVMFWHFVGFELTVIMCLATIIGEQHFMAKYDKREL